MAEQAASRQYPHERHWQVAAPVEALQPPTRVKSVPDALMASTTSSGKFMG